MMRYLWIVMMVIMSACTTSSVTHTPMPDATQALVNLTDTPVSDVGVSLTPVAVSGVGDGATADVVMATVGVTDTPIMVTATATPVVLVAQVARGWRFRQADMPDALFMFAGVRCTTNGADISGEWVIEANPVIEGVPFTAKYVVAVNPDQQTGTWQYEQFFAVDDVKSVARVSGQIAAVRIDVDGTVAFDLRVDGGITGALVTPDGEFPLEYPYPVTTLTNLTWVPMVDSCP